MCNLNIYLVEDNPLVATVLKQMIISMGHRICGIAPSYEKAITDLQKLTPDLVITDIMLEGQGTGIDLARYINQYLHIPFIYQSSIVSKSIIKQARATKPEAYLVKPVKKTDLQGLISPCLQ